MEGSREASGDRSRSCSSSHHVHYHFMGTIFLMIWPGGPLATLLTTSVADTAVESLSGSLSNPVLLPLPDDHIQGGRNLF